MRREEKKKIIWPYFQPEYNVYLPLSSLTTINIQMCKVLGSPCDVNMFKMWHIVGYECLWAVSLNESHTWQTGR